MSVVRVGAQEYPLKKAIGLIVENRRGYQSELNPLGEKRINSFKYAGFISTGHTLKSETYHTTELADAYYRDVFGVFSWVYHRVKGQAKKIIRKG